MFTPDEIPAQIFPPNPADFRLTEQEEVSRRGNGRVCPPGPAASASTRTAVLTYLQRPALTDAPSALFLPHDADERVTRQAALGLKDPCATMKVANLLLGGQKKAPCSSDQQKEPVPLQTQRIQQLLEQNEDGGS